MKQDLNLMAFSPTRGPIYGGNTMTIHLDDHHMNQADAKHFVVFEGSRQRHVVSARQSPSQNCLITYIPGHGVAEEVHVTLILLNEDKAAYQTLAQSYFQYEYDAVYDLTKFLTSSVYNNHALENLQLVMAERFDLSKESPSSLDTKLSRSLRNANLMSQWHLLGGDSINDAHCEERETLLHFCARLGLQRVAQYLLEQPGREDALMLPNRQGELAHTIASHNGFHDLAEMLSGYNTHDITAEQESVELDSAVLRNYGNGTASLTTFLDSASIDRTVENEISFLKETEEMMKVQRGFLSHCDFDSNWSTSNLEHNTGTSRSLPTLSLDQEMKESLDRLLTQQIIHHTQVQTFLRTSSLPVSDGTCTHSTGSFDDGNGGGSDGDAVDGSGDGAGGDLPHPVRSTSLKLGSAIRESALTNPAQPYGVLECSLSGVRDLTESLFQLRDLQRYDRLTREVRKRHFSRFSSSCPSLADPVQCLSLVPLNEGDHHKSMHDLVDASGRHSPTHLRVGADSSLPTKSSYSPTPHQETSFDQGIRICINGVTVDSSQDFPTGTGSPSPGETGGPSDRKYSRLGNGCGQSDVAVSRGSWSHASSDMRSSLPLDRRDQQTRVRMLAMTGKSLSLTSLEGDEESEEEDFVDAAREEEHHRAIVVPRSAYRFVGRDADIHSDSPVDSSGSSPGREVSIPEVIGQVKIPGDLSLSSGNAKSLTDLSMVGETTKAQRDELILRGSPGGPKHGAHHTYEDSGGLTVSHSSMTKSVSTPSIPQATEASEDGTLSQRERREGKQAQFRRQKEIEEEEDEDNATTVDKKAEISWKDFINEELSPNDSDDKSTKGFKKEDKKRKPNVFSRLHSSYRTKKNKEKEIKIKERHHFVSISVSNAAACDVCHKPMANKAALRCENCLVTVHEHSCKDQVAHCDKNRNKALQRDGPAHAPQVPPMSTHGALLERQSVSITGAITGTSLRPSQSFKDKRSVSAPVKTQPSQLSAPPQLSHRHSLPTSR